MKQKLIIISLSLFFLIIFPLSSKSYSVLTHEALIDANWDKYIEPLLKIKYPSSTADELKEAHAFAYGGAVMPDMGYYPFGSKFFTNLVHYVRSGDFVETLINEAQDVNEYAFALGALCHYNADEYGHRIGVNQSVPLVYPKMKHKYGNVVTYAEDKTSHIRMEFAFDVLQTARGNYATPSYHDFIGFKVGEPVLQRAFFKTYGLKLNDVFSNLSLAIETFRWTVKNVFPTITRVAWASRKNEIKKISPDITAKQFRYRFKRKEYIAEYGKKRKQPGVFANIFAFIIKILPKFGPLKALKFKTPNAQAEKLFIQSFDSVLISYSHDLKALQTKQIQLDNIDFDTGNETFPAEYKLTDKSYADLILKLQDKNFNSVSTSLKQNILQFYSDSTSSIFTKEDPKKWKKVGDAVEQLSKYSPPKFYK